MVDCSCICDVESREALVNVLTGLPLEQEEFKQAPENGFNLQFAEAFRQTTEQA